MCSQKVVSSDFFCFYASKTELLLFFSDAINCSLQLRFFLIQRKIGFFKKTQNISDNRRKQTPLDHSLANVQNPSTYCKKTLELSFASDKK